MARSNYVPGNNRLTNNYKANVAILITSFIVSSVGLYLSSWRLDEGIGGIHVNGGLAAYFLHLAVFSTVYIVTSYWFNPDLDLRRNRPGTKSFPFGPPVKYLNKLKRAFPVLKFVVVPTVLVMNVLHKPINLVWNLWGAPLGLLFTHRGVLHWPLIGSAIKLSYLQFTVYLCAGAYTTLRGWLHFITVLPDPVRLSPGWMYQFMTLNSFGVMILIAVLVADTCHTAVDYYDAVKNGNKNFIPPEFIAPRGVLIKFWRYIIKSLIHD